MKQVFDDNNSLNNRCPKCRRMGVEHIGGGFLQCLWRECHWLTGHPENYWRQNETTN